MAGRIIDRSNPWWIEGAPVKRPDPPRAANHGARRRALDRQDARRAALQSARDTLERVEPLVGAMSVPPADSAKLAVTRARIAAALFEVASLEAAMGATTPVNRGDPAILATVRLLADQLDRLAARARTIARRS